MKIGKILLAVLLGMGALAFGALVCVRIFTEGGKWVYYTQIDNSKVEQIEPGGGVVNFEGSLPYSYTLLCYDCKGKKQELTFGASKKLREGAYIQLVKQPIRGVVGWTEVQYEELPEAVQKKYWGRKE